MKKSSPFTLVRRVQSSQEMATTARPVKVDDNSGSEAAGIAKLSRPKSPRKALLGEVKPATLAEVGLVAIASKNAKTTDRAVRQILSTDRLKKAYSSLEENFKGTLLSSFTTQEFREDGTIRRVVVDPSIKAITEDLARGERVCRVAVIDFGTWMAGLPDLLDRLNEAQSMFTLFDILTALPSGLVKNPKGFREWVRARNPSSLRKLKVADARSQIIFDDFYEAAEKIRRKMGFDMLVGLTPHRVAGLDNDDKPYWDHFGATQGKVTLVSTDDVRRYSAEAKRPFEAGAGMLMVASLFVAVNSRLEYHRVDTGCLFDYNDDRESLITCIRNLSIDDHCFAMMSSDEVAAANGMLKALKNMRRRSVE